MNNLSNNHNDEEESDTLKIITFKKKERERKQENSISRNKDEHLKYINMLYCSQPFCEENKIKSEIKQKINNYKNQDIKKKRDDGLITFDETIEKMVTCKLKCYYCKQHTVIIYDDVRQKNQWTLERINNTISHTNENCVISCLQCNLKRRCQDSNRFKFSKQIMTIVKKD